MSRKPVYKPRKCPTCMQTTTVLYAMDHGTADLVKAIFVKIKIKGENKVHLRREMEVGRSDFSRTRMLNEGVITSTMVQNQIRAHKHGLIARHPSHGGNWVLTRKGAAFLRGEAIPRYAIQNKSTKHIEGYYEPEKHMVTIHELRGSEEPYWTDGSFDIVNGRLVEGEPAFRQEALSL